MPDLSQTLQTLVSDDGLRFTRARNGRIGMMYATTAAAEAIAQFGVQVTPLSEQARGLNPNVAFGDYSHVVDVTGVQGLEACLGTNRLYMAIIGMQEMPVARAAGQGMGGRG